MNEQEYKDWLQSLKKDSSYIAYNANYSRFQKVHKIVISEISNAYIRINENRYSRKTGKRVGCSVFLDRPATKEEIEKAMLEELLYLTLDSKMINLTKHHLNRLIEVLNKVDA